MKVGKCVGELTSPAEAQAETALRQNSSTNSEATLVPTTDRSSASDQNCRVVLQPDFRREDDLSAPSLSCSQRKKTAWTATGHLS